MQSLKQLIHLQFTISTKPAMHSFNPSIGYDTRKIFMGGNRFKVRVFFLLGWLQL